MSVNTAKNTIRKKQLKDNIKSSAIAACMTKNIGKQCYLYASHEGILWKF